MNSSVNWKRPTTCVRQSHSATTIDLDGALVLFLISYDPLIHKLYLAVDLKSLETGNSPLSLSCRVVCKSFVSQDYKNQNIFNSIFCLFSERLKMKTPPRLPSPTSKSRDWSKVNQSETTGTNMECEDHLPETSSGSDEYQFLSDLHSPKPMHNPIPNAEMGSFKSNGLHTSSKGITFCHYMIAVCSSSLLNRFNISPKFSQLDSHYGHEMVNMWAGLKGGV